MRRQIGDPAFNRVNRYVLLSLNFSSVTVVLQIPLKFVLSTDLESFLSRQRVANEKCTQNVNFREIYIFNKYFDVFDCLFISSTRYI